MHIIFVLLNWINQKKHSVSFFPCYYSYISTGVHIFVFPSMIDGAKMKKKKKNTNKYNSKLHNNVKEILMGDIRENEINCKWKNKKNTVWQFLSLISPWLVIVRS